MTQATFEQKLATIDLTRVMDRVMAETGISKAEAEVAEDLYRKFLTLKFLHPEQTIVPTRLVDEVWHNHVLFTRQYMADCELLFGKYMHHEPTADASLVENFARTSALYEYEFGLNLGRTISQPIHASMGGCGC